MKDTNERNAGLDVVRTLAIVFVILIHAIGFSIDGYSMPIIGFDGFFRIYLRRICYTCVPLFLILSGFLNVKKTNIIQTWKKAMPHLVGTYVFWCIVILLFDVFYLNEIFSVKSVIGIFNFTLPRTWYMDMYFGLLILMPFVNKCWENMNQKEKRILLVALFVVSMVSKYLQTASLHWFSNESYLVVISSYFYNASYIFYYLFGAYMREAQLTIKKRWLFLALQLVLVAHTGYYVIAGGGGFYNDIPGATTFWYDNPILAIESILLFLVSYDIKLKSKFIAKVVTQISVLAFDMYLVSYVFDIVAYKKIFPFYGKSPYYVVLCCCFILSFMASMVAAYLKTISWKKFKEIVKCQKRCTEGDLS